MRWAVLVDIEGFGALYEQETKAIQSLAALMEGIFLIGSRVFSQSPDRLFAHQIGDGFLIVGEFGSASLDRPVAIAVALLRHVAATGRFAKATIAEGDFADIQGFYPDAVRSAPGAKSGRVPMGAGLMTTFTVMGTALIRAVGLSKSVSGALLLADAQHAARLPPCVHTSVGQTVVIDWLHSTIPEANVIQQHAGLCSPPTAEISGLLKSYLALAGVPNTWASSTKRYLSL